MPRVEPGSVVAVTDREGATRSGRLAAVTPGGLVLTVRGGQSETLSEADVVRVVHKDSNLDGVIAGLIVGAGAGALIAGRGCGGYIKCSALEFVVGLPIGAGVGLVGGLVLDASLSRTLFERPRTVRVVIAPLLVAHAAGGSLVVRWP